MRANMPSRAEYMQRLGERIRSAREAAGMTQVDLARVSGIDNSSLSHYESGRRMPCPLTLSIIVRSLDVSAKHMLGLDA